MYKATGRVSLLAGGLLLLQCIDQFGGREEAHAPVKMQNGLYADSRCQVCLPVPGPPTSTTLWAYSRKSQRCSDRTSAL